MIFYWFNVIDVLREFSLSCFVLSIIAILFSSITMFVLFEERGTEFKEYIFAKKVIKITIPILIISFLIILFCPDKETLIAMWIANHSEFGIESIKNATDYIINAIKEIN